MGFLNVLQRTSPAATASSADQIIWGVRRKLGYSEIFDPSVHRGREQHAFVIGDYSVALCGAKAHGWRKPSHIRLAMPTDENPACRKCSMAIAFDVSEAISLDRLGEMTAPADRDEVEKAVKAARKQLTAGEPVSIQARRHQKKQTETKAEPRMHNWPVKDFSQAA